MVGLEIEKDLDYLAGDLWGGGKWGDIQGGRLPITMERGVKGK